MLTRRIIACLDVRDGRVVKGVHFAELRNAGDPATLARRYAAEGIDEVVVLDITATLEDRGALLDTIRAVSRELFVPLTAGGGIRTCDDARAAIEAGADKVSLNSAALADPALITRLAGLYGSQAVVIAIDAKKAGNRYQVFSRSGTTPVGCDAVSWAREVESRGAGEILLTDVDRDGTGEGLNHEVCASIADSVSIPVILSGGCGRAEHFIEGFKLGHAEAVAAGTFFAFRDQNPIQARAHVRNAGIPIRMET